MCCNRCQKNYYFLQSTYATLFLLLGGCYSDNVKIIQTDNAYHPPIECPLNEPETGLGTILNKGCISGYIKGFSGYEISALSCTIKINTTEDHIDKALEEALHDYFLSSRWSQAKGCKSKLKLKFKKVKYTHSDLIQYHHLLVEHVMRKLPYVISVSYPDGQKINMFSKKSSKTEIYTIMDKHKIPRDAVSVNTW